MFRFLFLSLLFWGLTALPVQAAKRALIIGNDAYTELPNVQKAVADARAYTSVLLDLGYDVSKSEDLSTSAMQRAIGSFIDTVQPGDEVAFVYAGHGWSDGSSNYIVGADTEKLTTSATLRRTAIPVENGINGVVDDLRGRGARIVLAVLDACRNNPFQSKNGRSGSVGLARGLVLLTPVSGTFTIFSAGAGEKALDRLDDTDEHPNSVFSRVFLEELRSGGNLQDIILNTAPQVTDLAKAVGHSQRPSYYDGIGERYCLTADCSKRETTKIEPAAVALIAEPGKEVSAVTPTETKLSDIFLSSSPLPNMDARPERERVTSSSIELTIAVPVPNPPAQTSERTQLRSPDARATIIVDPYFRPAPHEPTVLKPAQVPQTQQFGAPVQFIVRSASPIRSLAQLDGESICSVARTPQQPTIATFFRDRKMSHNNRQFRNLKMATAALERSQCGAIAVPPRLVTGVISAVRDASRYIVLPEIVR